MKQLTIFLIVMALVFVACQAEKKQETAQNEPVKEKAAESEFYYFPLPSFQDVFGKLDYLTPADFGKFVPEDYSRVDNDEAKAAFALGSLSADAILVTKSRNRTKLLNIAQEMIFYSKAFIVEERILQLADKLKKKVETDSWDELQATLDDDKQGVINALYDAREYDYFILMQLGGWVEGLYQTAMLLNDNYDRDKTDFLYQIGILNQLINNVEKMPNAHIKEKEYYQTSLGNLTQIRDMLKAPEDKMYSKEEVERLIDLTEKIKQAFK